MAYVDLVLDHDHGLDSQQLLAHLPAGLVQRGPNFYSTDSRLGLTAAGLSFVPAAARDLENFVCLVQACAKQESEGRFGPLEIGTYHISVADSEAIWPSGIDADEMVRALAILQIEGLYRQLSGTDDPSAWTVRFDRDVRRYRDTVDLNDYLSRRPEPDQRTWAPPPPVEPFVFVLMPFGAPWSDNVYDSVGQACEEASRIFSGLRAQRADDITVPGRITDQITSAIERADVLIADITNLNPNVLFELGYGDALGKPIIVLNQDVEATPFDIKDWRQIAYGADSLKTMRSTLLDFLTGTLLTAGFTRATAGVRTGEVVDVGETSRNTLHLQHVGR